MNRLDELALRGWQRLRTRALGGVLPHEDPVAAMTAAGTAVRALSAAAAHAALRPLIGWAPARTAGQVADDLAGILRPGAALLAWSDGADPELLAELAAESVNLSAFYETLLTADWRAGTTADQHTRRAFGAFHTPEEFTRRVVARTAAVVARDRLGDASDLARARLLSSLRVADLAVGPGRFPVAWLEHLRELGLLHDLLVEAARNLELTDVDQVALELAAVACAVTVGDATLLADGPRLRHGNALLHRAGAGNPAAAFVAGRIWDPAVGVAAPEEPVDLVLGNPPWERVRVEPRPLLRGLLDAAADDGHRASRDEHLDATRSSHPLLHAWLADVRASTADGLRAMRADPRLARGARGELYTHVLFTELALDRVRERDGWVAVLVKSAMLTSTGHAALMRPLLDGHQVHEVWDYRNEERIFDIDSRERFAFLLAGPATAPHTRLATGLTRVRDLGDEALLTTLDDELRLRINPSSGLLPACTREELPRLLALSASPLLGDAYPDAHFGRLLHLTNHSEGISRHPAPGLLPVWEGRMIEQYTARFATFAGVTGPQRWSAKVRATSVRPEQRADPYYRPEARWWVRPDVWEKVARRHAQPFSLVWRNASSPFNRRTMLATVLPRVPTIQSVQLLQLPDAERLLQLCGVLDSLPFDWLLRRRMPGIDVTGTVVRQVPVPDPAAWKHVVAFGGARATLGQHLLTRVGALLADDAAVHPLLASALGAVPPPAADRGRTRREVDVLVAHGYGLSLADLCELAADFSADVPADEVEMLRAGGYGVVREGSAAASRDR
ncbi:hypothetical protein LY71_1084 [Geodermatophilus tzadiensis]|uniref:site-specific DNA-methyltransferase (adenine-specific) n=1 Tax=Geodermatophilus tzadiensis TaxID=1137988 RepID=A0A2T0TSF0_9ACTN|nr:hypothetical protein [Geodermatophilus tzadiensis]PRY48626.1 hypothetical protein LY71_1084 [Geodermatophilus tzadiensis]